jgi:GNAT superfamily N-acetyltransferase
MGEFLTALRQGHALVMNGGTTFAWWHVEAHNTWYLSYICACPRGRGNGTLMLEALLHRADVEHASVVLYCSPKLIEWYERHGFRQMRPATPRDHLYRHGRLVCMRRRPSSAPST